MGRKKKKLMKPWCWYPLNVKRTFTSSINTVINFRPHGHRTVADPGFAKWGQTTASSERHNGVLGGAPCGQRSRCGLAESESYCERLPSIKISWRSYYSTSRWWWGIQVAGHAVQTIRRRSWKWTLPEQWSYSNAWECVIWIRGTYGKLY